MRRWLIIMSILVWAWSGHAQTFQIVSYNVENLFDYTHDTLRNDYEYLPDGLRHWTRTRYWHKTEQIARVIANIGEWKTPDVIGLCEVENDYCVQGVCRKLKHANYRYLHYESEDERGIDVALLYLPKRFVLIDSAALHVDLGQDKTRDILYAAGIIPSGDTLHVMVAHLPSMLGGAKASEWKRKTAKSVIQRKVDSLISHFPNAKIVVMGDMNSSPQDDIRGLHNRMTELPAREGSHKWQGIWSYLDQFYVSPAIDSIAEVQIYSPMWLLERDEKYLNYKPLRTFNGFHYQYKGFSDHLPIILSW